MPTDGTIPESPGDLLISVYDALRELAAVRLAAERPDHTLQATALVHEVYLKLSAESPGRWNDSAHFFNTAAEAMRRMLVDHARARGRLKRGGERRDRVPLSEAIDVATLAETTDPDDVLALDAALTRLEQVSAEAAQVIRLRFYAGLTIEQTAEAMKSSPRSIKRGWQYARAWLYRELTVEKRKET